MEQLGDGVGAHAGVPFEHPGCFRRRGDTEHGTTLGVQVVDGGGEHPRLARTGRTDHQHETVLAGHRGGGVGLQHIEAGALDGPRRRRGFGLSIDRPGENPLLLDEHRLGGEPRRRWLDPQRATIESRRCVASGGSKSTQRSSTLSAACRSRLPSGPDICDTGRCRSQIAWMTSGRPHDECSADTASTTSLTVSESVGERSAAAARRARRAVRRSSRPLPPRPATVSPDRRHRARTCGPGYRPRLHAPGRALLR